MRTCYPTLTDSWSDWIKYRKNWKFKCITFSSEKLSLLLTSSCAELLSHSVSHSVSRESLHEWTLHSQLQLNGVPDSTHSSLERAKSRLEELHHVWCCPTRGWSVSRARTRKSHATVLICLFFRKFMIDIAQHILPVTLTPTTSRGLLKKELLLKSILHF